MSLVMSDLGIPFTPIVSALPASTPFVGPEALERRFGAPFKARIGANESAFGPSPRVREAIAAASAQVSWYGDPENYDLRTEIAKREGVDIDEVVVGAGIDSLLGLIVRMTVSAGTPVVTSLGAYPTFNYQVAAVGGVLHTAPYKDDHEDPDALLALAKETHAPLVFIANPDNPMGTWHSADVIERMVAQVPDGRLLILDEAYSDFAPPNCVPGRLTVSPRVVRTRTFSKAHGLAGARVGYAIAHREVISGINRIRNQFEVSRLSQMAALASLQDPGYIATVLQQVEEAKQDYTAIAKRHGYSVIPSATNFVALDMGDAQLATKMMSGLAERGVFVRMPGAFPLNRCIRVTAGLKEDRKIFEEAFADCHSR